jgi:hypothetical protein
MRIKKEDIIKEAIEEMKTLVNNDDYEIAHIEADDILCNVLKKLGYEELVDVYEQVGKWYA